MIIHRGFVALKKRPGDRHEEVVCTTNSVAFLFADMKNEVVLLVSQDRPAMIRKGNSEGQILEVPAGRRDLKITIKNLVVKEAREEIGKRILPQQVRLLNRGVPLALSPGILTERMYLAYVETDLSACIKDSSKVYGLAAHGERIRRMVISFSQLETMVFADMKTFAIINWFLRHNKKGR